MLSSLRAMIAKIPLLWATRHIEGHQDDDVNAKLDFWARQNIQMDNLAKIFWMQHSHSAHVQYPIMEEDFQVWLGDRKLSSHSSSVFFDYIHGKTILSWHATHGRFPACYARRVDWEVCHAALKRLSLGKRRWVSKHTSGFCSVGTKMVKWKEQPTPDCPRCGQIENTRHVYGYVLNRRFSLSGICLCPPSVIGSRPYTQPKKLLSGSLTLDKMAKSGTLLDGSNRSSGPITGDTGSRSPGLARLFRRMYSKRMGRSSTYAFPVARTSEYRKVMGNINGG
jgi:hypothetical protein